MTVNTKTRSTTLPKALDEKVAGLHLAKLGVELTVLDPVQASYIGVSLRARSSRNTIATKHRIYSVMFSEVFQTPGRYMARGLSYSRTDIELSYVMRFSPPRGMNFNGSSVL